MDEVVTRILRENGIDEPHTEFESSGLANRIFATSSCILRIPTDHEEAMNDARTESVDAPLARKHGILSPRLIRFDDSCRLLDRSYSLWERIHGRSLDLVDRNPELDDVWITLGKELGPLHTKVKDCPDPKNWLDRPERDYSQEDMLRAVADAVADPGMLVPNIRQLFEQASGGTSRVFVHGDPHPGNIMCTMDHAYAGLIDWGDAGWAEPSIDFYMIPPQVLDRVVSGYREVNPHAVDDCFLSQLILDKIWVALASDTDGKRLEGLMAELDTRLRGADVPGR